MGGVLLIDDSMFMRHLYKKMLAKHDIEVTGEAGNGYEGIAQYMEIKPDVAILDINMPGMSGMEALKEIRRQDAGARVIMSSAMGQEAFVRECVLGGAKAFLVKPIVERALIDTIKYVLKQK